MSVRVALLEGRDLKSTQMVGKQDPYALVSLELDLGPIFGVSPDAATAKGRILEASRLKAEEWKSGVVEDGNLAPKWPEGEESVHEFKYVPGADCIVVRLMNKNMSSDAFIGQACISLFDAFLNGEVEAWHPLKRESGRQQGEVLVRITWTMPETPPFRVMVPLTFEVRGGAGAVSSKYSLAHKTLGDVKDLAGKKAGDAEVLATMKSVLPTVVEMFGEDAYPILALGGAPVESVEADAVQCGLKEHDIIVGYAVDQKVTDGGRGVLALVNGTVKWGPLQATTRDQILKELKQFDAKGSITLTVLRALPLKVIPDDHGLKKAYVSAPSSFRYEPQQLSCIADETLAPLHPDVRPSKGRPFTFQAPLGLPDGVELSEEGVLRGVPTAVGQHTMKIVASNPKGSISTDVHLRVMKAPSELQYAQGHHLQYALLQPITVNQVAKIDGDGPFKFYCEPPLPRGLQLDPASGAISGTPEELSASAESVVTATSAAGSVTASIIISVLAPPSDLAYPAATFVLVRGQLLADIKVSQLQGSHPFLFTCSPTLPAGLSIDSSSGSLTGTPSAECAQSEYRLCVSNVAGSAEFAFSLAVLEQPSGLSYQQGGRGAKLSYTVGCAIIENRVMTLTGSAPVTFSCNPALPDGLQIDHATGLISGTPTTEVEPAMFEMVAMNAVGITSCQLLLEVVAGDDAPADSTFDPAATEIAQPMEQLQGPGAEVKTFLERVGVAHRFDDFVNDGWDTLEMIYAMSKMDLVDVGLSEAEAEQVMAGQPSAQRAEDRRAMKRFMADKGFQDLEPPLISKGVKGLQKLLALTLQDLAAIGIPLPRAQALHAELQKLTAPPPSPAVVAPAPALIEQQTAQAGVGLSVSQMPPVGLWFVTDVLRGGSAFSANCIANGDRLYAVASAETNGLAVKIVPQTTLNDIRNLILGPVGSYVTLTLQRQGTRFDVPLLRAPTQAPTAKKPEKEITLKMQVSCATNLPAMDRCGTSDPYVIIQCNGQACKTPVIWKTLNPTWKAVFALRVGPSSKMVLSVWDKDQFDPDDLIGKLHVSMKDVVDFDTPAVKMKVLKGRLQTSDGGAAHGLDGGHSHLYLEFTEVQP